MAVPENRVGEFLSFLRERNVEAVEVGQVIPPIRPDRRDRIFIFIKQKYRDFHSIAKSQTALQAVVIRVN